MVLTGALLLTPLLHCHTTAVAASPATTLLPLAGSQRKQTHPGLSQCLVATPALVAGWLLLAQCCCLLLRAPPHSGCDERQMLLLAAGERSGSRCCWLWLPVLSHTQGRKKGGGGWLLGGVGGIRNCVLCGERESAPSDWWWSALLLRVGLGELNCAHSDTNDSSIVTCIQRHRCNSANKSLPAQPGELLMPWCAICGVLLFCASA